MVPRVLRRSAFVLAGIVVAGACGDDGLAPQSQFNEFEANQVVSAVASVISEIEGGPGASANVNLALAIVSANATRNCSNGGTAALVGTRDDGPAVNLDVRVQFVQCETVSLTLNGFLDITVVRSTPSEGTVRTESSILGTVNVLKDERTRSCTIDLERVRTVNSGGSPSVTSSGTICGRTA